MLPAVRRMPTTFVCLLCVDDLWTEEIDDYIVAASCCHHVYHKKCLEKRLSASTGKASCQNCHGVVDLDKCPRLEFAVENPEIGSKIHYLDDQIVRKELAKAQAELKAVTKDYDDLNDRYNSLVSQQNGNKERVVNVNGSSGPTSTTIPPLTPVSEIKKRGARTQFAPQTASLAASRTSTTTAQNPPPAPNALDAFPEMKRRFVKVKVERLDPAIVASHTSSSNITKPSSPIVVVVKDKSQNLRSALKSPGPASEKKKRAVRFQLKQEIAAIASARVAAATTKPTTPIVAMDDDSSQNPPPVAAPEASAPQVADFVFKVPAIPKRKPGPPIGSAGPSSSSHRMIRRSTKWY